MFGIHTRMYVFYILCAATIGCSTLVTGFIPLESNKKTQIKELFGQGIYYRFDANGSDLRELDISGERAIKILIDQNKNKPKECSDSYKIISLTYSVSKGGSASIIVRCKFKPDQKTSMGNRETR